MIHGADNTGPCVADAARVCTPKWTPMKLLGNSRRSTGIDALPAALWPENTWNAGCERSIPNTPSGVRDDLMLGEATVRDSALGHARMRMRPALPIARSRARIRGIGGLTWISFDRTSTKNAEPGAP